MDDKYSSYFMQLILIFHTAAMQHMGKLKNPMTDTIERDLMQAQAAIDMLDMMKEKTKGNLNSDEERFLTTMLQELKLNYVDELNKPDTAGPQPGAAPEEPPQTQDTK